MIASKADLQRANAVFAELEHRAEEEFKHEGIGAEPQISRTIELRYFGQNFELEVPVKNGALNQVAFNDAIEHFHREHERLYNYSIRGEECEVLNFSVTAGSTWRPVQLPRIGSGLAPEPIGVAKTYLEEDETPSQIPLYDRTKFGVGTKINGPAILGQMDTTTLLPSGAVAEVDEYGNLIIDMKGASH
jgi:N-methylhydantoinase A